MIELNRMLSSRSHLISLAIGLIVLAIISSLAFKFPGSGTFITEGLFVGHIIKLVIAVIVFFMVLEARSPLATLVTYYTGNALKVREPNRAKAVPYVQGLSKEIANVIVIAIIWPIVTGALRILFRIDVLSELDWILILVNLLFLAILLYRLYLGYQTLRPAIAVISGAPSVETLVACPKCAGKNPPAAKFCSSCGVDLEAAQKEAEAPKVLRCPKCNTENSPDAKFCINCGAPLS